MNATMRENNRVAMSGTAGDTIRAAVDVKATSENHGDTGDTA